MLDHVERRRVLEQPAREDLAPGQRVVGSCPLLDEDLDEGTLLFGLLPWKSPLAGREPHDDIAYAARFAGFQHDVLGQIVPLVEQAERCHPVLDRRAELAFDRRRADRPCRYRLGDIGRFGIRLIAAAATGKRGGEKKG